MNEREIALETFEDSRVVCPSNEVPQPAEDLESPSVTVQTENEGRDKWMNLSLIAAFLLWVTFQVSVALSRYVLDDNRELIILSVLLVGVALGIISICILLEQLLKGKTVVKRGKVIPHEKPLYTLLRNSLSLVGLAFFCPFACLLEMFQIFMAVSCQRLYKSDDNKADFYYIFDSVFHTLHVVFMTLELLFCVQFRNLEFAQNISKKRRFFIKLSLMIIVSVNFGLWFNIVVNETTQGQQDSHVHQFLNDSEEILTKDSCKKSVFDNVGENVKHTLYPFTVEFCLLVLEYVTSRFVFGKNFHEETCEQKSEIYSKESEDKSQELQTQVSMIESCTSISHILNDHIRQRNQRKIHAFSLEYPLLAIFGVFPNMICITLVYFAKDETNDPSNVNFTVIQCIQFLICYWTLMILLVTVGIVCICSCRTMRHEKLKVFDFLVIASSAGPCLSKLLRILIVSGHIDAIQEIIDPVVALLPEVLNLLQLLLQLPFLFYADSANFLAETRKTPAVRIFKATVLSLAFWNINLWLIDSLLLKVDILVVIFKGSSWQFLDGIFRPLTIFFRFNSFLILLRAFLR